MAKPFAFCALYRTKESCIKPKKEKKDHHPMNRNIARETGLLILKLHHMHHWKIQFLGGFFVISLCIEYTPKAMIPISFDQYCSVNNLNFEFWPLILNVHCIWLVLNNHSPKVRWTLVNICRMKTKSTRWIFSNVHSASGE